MTNLKTKVLLMTNVNQTNQLFLLRITYNISGNNRSSPYKNYGISASFSLFVCVLAFSRTHNEHNVFAAVGGTSLQ